MREKRDITPVSSQEKFARFKQVANDDPGALQEALVQLAEAFSSMADSAEALVENLDLAPVPKEATIKEKVAARKKFATHLKKLANESPEAVEEAVNEIYNAVDEVAAAIETLAQNLGFNLSEIPEEEVVIDEEVPGGLEGPIEETVDHDADPNAAVEEGIL
jgi:DNA-directed RNA polymerase subunit F